MKKDLKVQKRSLRLGSFFLALIGAASGGCATTDSGTDAENDITATPETDGFLIDEVLTVTSGENDITVLSSSGTDTCPAFETRNFAYIAGTALTIKTFPTNLPDCERFIRWDGVCAGQTNQCNLVINSDLSTTSVFGPILGCVPK